MWKMEPYKKGQNLLEDFVWLIDTGRLMGDPNYSVISVIFGGVRWSAGLGWLMFLRLPANTGVLCLPLHH